MAHLIKSEDLELVNWSKEISQKKIDMTLPRIRVQDYMQEDPNRWIVNSTLDRLKSRALQSYFRVEEATVELLNLDSRENDGVDIDGEPECRPERVISEVASSPLSCATRDMTITISASTIMLAKSDKNTIDYMSEMDDEMMLPTAPSVGSVNLDEEELEVYYGEDGTTINRDRLIQREIEKRVNAYLLEHDVTQKNFSSTIKLFSNSSATEYDDDEERREPVELKRFETVPVQTQAETLQEILLTPMPGPGFRMAQVAHPDDVFDQNRLLPSVYFVKPRVRIFSAFPHCQQFWCRQGNPIPVPPPSKRNTFMDSHHLSSSHPKVKFFPFRVRSYKAHMLGFRSDELIFIVEGRNVFVTGEKRKNNKIIRTVTEEICLPIDLDLNYLRVAHSKKGEVIFEELWEYEGKAN